MTNRLKFFNSKDELSACAEDLMSRLNSAYDDIARTTAPTFSSTFQRLALLEGDLEASTNSVTFPSYVHTDKAVRDASSDCSKKLEHLAIELTTREDVYRVLRAVDLAGLDAIDARLARKVLEDFERAGMALPKEQRDELKRLRQRISELCIQFQQTLNEDTTSLVFTADELRGMPETFLSGLARAPDGVGYVVTLKYPDLFPVLKFCSVPETRRRMDEAHGRQCMQPNVAVIEEVFALRHRAARLLGFASDAEFELSVLMAKTPANVRAFLDGLLEKVRPFGQRELAVLSELKRQEEPSSAPAIAAHDFRYYHQRLLLRDFAIDEEAIRQYFPLDVVLDGMLGIYQDMLALTFTETPRGSFPAWHADVRHFTVRDRATDAPVGEFYLDLHPRDGKYGHAAAFSLQGAARLPSGTQLPICALVCNFSEPANGAPALLDFNEVVTLFHEFGHGTHNLCSTSRYQRFAGTSVERDFVEAPSQMLENWCYQVPALTRMSRHWKTGEPIPQAHVNALIAAKNADVGLLTLRQLFFALFDQTCHSQERTDTGALWAQMRREVSLVPSAEGCNPVATFGHLAGGYNARYYGYLYSDVFASDMFESRFAGRLQDPRAGSDYRHMILSHGGSRDSMESLKEFLGRPPNDAAFLKHNGLL